MTTSSVCCARSVANGHGIRRHYDLVAEATALRPHATEIPAHPLTPAAGDGAGPFRPEAGHWAREGTAQPMGQAGPGARAVAAAVAESEEQPEEVRHLTIVPVATLDLPSMRALAYAASLRQPMLALHLSPTEEEAERFRCYWQTWGDQLPLEVIVSPHRAIVAPLVNYIWSLAASRAQSQRVPRAFQASGTSVPNGSANSPCRHWRIAAEAGPECRQSPRPARWCPRRTAATASPRG
jgi:hypothetical protein